MRTLIITRADGTEAAWVGLDEREAERYAFELLARSEVAYVTSVTPEGGRETLAYLTDPEHAVGHSLRVVR